ncbi:MAG: glycosyltransferase [Paludibacteraceae bacterium]|nr:glycosyltransferase [Paludibacteraceae bacterium]
MKLSIITINYNNVEGLRKTLASVGSQTYGDIEHIVVDAASTDGSVDVIKEYEQELQSKQSPIRLLWISEPDKGIYSGMNKGICRATGDYCQFLNSGDTLASADVTAKMAAEWEKDKTTDVLYGDMLKTGTKSRHVDRSNRVETVTLNMFYRGCLNHSPAYIRRSLFEDYGLYDETLKICSDWKFYMQSIVLGKATTRHADIVVTHFDMNGISETRKDILNDERNRLLKELVPNGILADYDKYHFAMSEYNRLRRHHLWGLVWFVERVLFKLEKWGVIRG